PPARRRSRAADRSGRGGRAMTFPMKPALLVTIVCAACGGGIKGRIQSGGGKPSAPKLEPVKPAAMREFEAAVRAVRLGGPEAQETAKARLQAAIKLEPRLWEA